MDFLDALAQLPASVMTVAAVIVFSLTWVLIASRRLALLPIGRPAGALVGAVLMVAVGALTTAQAYQSINADTIVLLLGMMLVTAYLDRAGFFAWVANALLSACHTPYALLLVTAVLAAGLSALLVNDAVCLFLTPVVVATTLRARLPMGPYLMALATSANIGSAATLVGNPQNMIIGSLSGIPFGRFLLLAGPAALVGLLVNLALLTLYYRARLPRRMPPVESEASPVDRPRLVLAGLVGAAILTGLFLGTHLAFTVLAGAIFLLVADRRDATPLFARVDWPLLVFFASLFIVVAGLEHTGLPARAWNAIAVHVDLHRADGLSWFAAAMTAGANVVSNVPMVLLTGPHLEKLGSPELGWVLLAFTTTVAGNLTLVGSVANIIVAEGAKAHYGLGFREYLRFGLPSTLLVLAAGVPIVAWLAGF